MCERGGKGGWGVGLLKNGKCSRRSEFLNFHVSEFGMHEQPPPTSISSYLPRLLSQAADAELAETIDMLRRATAILEKEMAKTGFIQTDAIDKVADALSALVSAGRHSCLSDPSVGT